MKIVHTIEEVRALVREARQKGQTIGLMPTLGFIHEGHLSLLRKAKEQCDFVVMSVFVNPLQFGPNEDFDRYPRDLQHDAALAEKEGVNVVFAPSVDEMYPAGNGKSLTFVEVEQVTDVLCGASRPGHFRGVATVVTKLLNIVLPDKAFFGMKDAQQVAVLQQMVNDLNMPVEIVRCPIVREPDGLALSSRNVYLSAEERKQALVLSRSLRAAEALVAEGERNAARIVQAVRDLINEQPLADIEYVELVHMPDLQPVETVTSDVLLALAVRFGTTRLIDNTILNVQ